MLKTYFSTALIIAGALLAVTAGSAQAPVRGGAISCENLEPSLLPAWVGCAART